MLNVNTQRKLRQLVEKVGDICSDKVLKLSRTSSLGHQAPGDFTDSVISHNTMTSCINSWAPIHSERHAVCEVPQETFRRHRGPSGTSLKNKLSRVPSHPRQKKQENGGING